MAILQISRIQNRRGLQENLPQLASAELGWALDTRKLYIGNGDISEGAPTLGVTEILTQYSDMIGLSGTYTFEGLASAGYTVDTLPNSLAPVSRSMQDKFDDLANFRDFGGIGDGSTNEVNAFNNAITQLYNLIPSPHPIIGTHTVEQQRRTLYIPAGTYILSGDFIRLLPYVKLKGDGKNSTYIIQTDATQPCVISSCDSTGTTGFAYTDLLSNVAITNTSIGSQLPGYIEVDGITFINQTNNDVVYLNSVTDVLFNRIAMQGPQTVAPSSAGGSHACIKIGQLVSGSQSISNNIVLRDCDYVGENFALYCDNNITNVNIIGGSHKHLYRGVSICEGLVGIANVSSIKVSYGVFDDISKEAIYSPSAAVSNIVSAFNTFNIVGLVSAVNLYGNNCYSFGDIFGSTYAGANPGVSLNGSASFATLPNGQLLLGTQLTNGGEDVALSANIAMPSLVGIIGVGTNATILEYSIFRSPDQRSGIMKITSDGINSPIYDDEYVETTDLGIELIPVLNSNNIELTYINTGLSATLKTSTRTLI